MTTCGQCKHWAPPEPKDDEDPIPFQSFGRCGRIAHTGSRDPYCSPAELSEKLKDEKAVASDASGYFAVIKCHADFGCVLFEQKHTPPAPRTVGFDTVTELP